MKKLLAFKTVAVDTLAIRAGTTIHAGESFRFFGEYRDLNDDDVTNEREEEIIQWVLSSSGRDLLLQELGVAPDAFLALSVKRPVIPHEGSKPGDIDLLICGNNRAHEAIGIQCKRVRVRAFSQEEDDFNKLSDVTGGVKQANFQRKNLAFHRNYLMIIIESYGRQRPANNVLFRGPNRTTFNAIYQFPQRESLHADVGVIFVTVSQPTGKSFDQMSMIGVCIDQEAAHLDQTPELTNRIIDLMRRGKQ